MVLISVLLKAVIGILCQLAREKNFCSKKLRRMIVKNLGANIASNIPLRYARSIQKPTGVSISEYCKRHHLEHEAVRLEPEGEFAPATLHFLGQESHVDDGNVLLYLHGGGYVFPLIVSHIMFALKAAQAARARLAILEYTLAPELEYPGQLAQAVSALRFILGDAGGNASRIVVGGDSAGGNLTLALLAHMRQQHPGIAPMFGSESRKVDFEPRFRAAFCISPRCANVCNTPSYDLNASKDIVGRKSMQLFTSNWKPVNEDVWATPISGDKEFWSRNPLHARKVLLVAGEDEVYVDDIRQLAALMGAQELDQYPDADVQVKTCAGEFHCQAIFDQLANIPDGLMKDAVLDWLRKL